MCPLFELHARACLLEEIWQMLLSVNVAGMFVVKNKCVQVWETTKGQILF